MNALRKIHDALAPGGLVLDSQPLSARPPVDTDAGPLGTLDMTEWARTIATIDERIEQTIRDGLFELVEERRFVVTDEFGDGAEFVGVTREWLGTQVDDAFAALVGAERGPVRVHQDVRLRVLRAR